jgi:hypothetical protein
MCPNRGFFSMTRVYPCLEEALTRITLVAVQGPSRVATCQEDLAPKNRILGRMLPLGGRDYLGVLHPPLSASKLLGSEPERKSGRKLFGYGGVQGVLVLYTSVLLFHSSRDPFR